MTTVNKKKKKIRVPKILVIGGHDPTGGAGIQADIETIKSHNCHPVTLISCLTSQNTNKFKRSYPVDPRIFREQADLLLSDVSIDIIKIGAVGSAEILMEIMRLLKKINKPTVFDPIISPAMGGKLTSKGLLEEIKKKVFPFCYLITPNFNELLTMTNSSKLILEDLKNLGTKYILVKDSEPKEKNIVNTLYFKSKFKKEWQVERVKKEFHGTGCTLAAAIAANLSNKISIEESISLALQFINLSINDSFSIGKGQRILRR